MAGATLLYFDFAGYLGRDAFSGKVASADWFGVARMEDFRIALAAEGRLTAQPVAGAAIWGILWMLPAESLPWLDDHFGVAQGHARRTTARVVSPAGPRTEAMVYLPTGTAAAGKVAPDRAAIVAAARALRFPAAYLAELAALA
ncbi:MAG TPA: gamma-glutamylcyclotransferase [Opitutaceae bacterium]